MKQLVKIFGRFASKQAEGNQRRPSRRHLRSETLEKRQLLAGDVLAAHNYSIPEDVNGDWRVTPLDALLVLNHLRNQKTGAVAEGEQDAVQHWVDVNGDNHISPLDALHVLNRLSLGEAIDPVLEMSLQPRTVEDEEFTGSAFNQATRELIVDVNEVFYLEVQHRDLRDSFERSGVFAFFADVLVDQSHDGAGALMPVLTETQIIGFDNNLQSNTRGYLDFYLETTPDVVHTIEYNPVNAVTLGRQIRSAVAEITGYEQDVVEVTSLTAPETLSRQYQIRFNDLSLDGLDLPNVMITPRLVNGPLDGENEPANVTITTRDIKPLIDGKVNPQAIADNVNFVSSDYPVGEGGDKYFSTYFDGSYHEELGFLHVGGTGPLNPDGPDDVDFDSWFDSFSIPVRLTQPVDKLQVSLRAPTGEPDETTHGMVNPGQGYGSLFYQQSTPIPPDLIQIDLTNDLSDPNDGLGLLLLSTRQTAEVTISASDSAVSVDAGEVSDPIDLTALVVTNSTETPAFTISDDPDNGTYTLVDGVLRYTPNSGFSGTDVLQYTATVPGADPATGTITLTVVAAPVVEVEAADATLTAVEDGPAVDLDLAGSITVSGSSTPPTVNVPTQPTKGTVSVSGTVVTYTPTAGQTGADSFDYVVTVDGVTATATVNVTITAAAVVEVTAGDGSLNVVGDSSGDDLDLRPLVTVTGGSGSDPLTLTLLDLPGKGTATLTDGVVTYVPTVGQTGNDSFTYTATVNGVTDTGTINVTIAPPSTITINAGNGSLNADENGPSVSLDATALVTTNSTETPTLTITGNPTKGMVEIVDGQFIYTPLANQSGSDSFTYTASVSGASDTGTINVVIEPEATIEVHAGDGTLTAEQDGETESLNLASLVSVTGVPSNPTRVYEIVGSGGERGTATISGSTLQYTPAAGQHGTDTITYRVTVDGVADTGTITVTINPTVITVQAANGSINAAQDGDAVSLNVRPLVTVTGSSATPVITIGSNPNRGSAVVSGTNVVYTPAPGQHGSDSFTYVATVNGVTDTATINVTISAAAVVVEADNATLTATENGLPQTIDLASLVTVIGSTAPPLFTLPSGPSLGTGTVSGSVLTYTPPTSQSGTTTIVYRATVGDVSDTGTITITVNPAAVSDPVARPDQISAVANTTTTIDVSELTANDSPADPNPSGSPVSVLDVAAIPGTTRGTVSYNSGTGVISYTPADNFTGLDTFHYTITSEGRTATGVVTVNVQDFVESSISGSVFMDYPQSYSNPQPNGYWDSDEPAVGGVVIRLTSPANANLLGQNIERMTRTDADGYYHFGDLAPGTYRVTFERPDTFKPGDAHWWNDSGVQVDGESFLVEIDSAGGVSHTYLDFSVTGYQGAAASAGQLLVSDFLLLHPESPNNINRPDYGLATMVIGDSSGQQTSFDLTQGFDDVLFAEIAIGRSGGSALLTLIMDDGSVKTALLSQEDGDFVISSNGSVVHVLRNVLYMNFIDSPQDLMQQEYGNYRSAVDQVLAAGL